MFAATSWQIRFLDDEAVELPRVEDLRRGETSFRSAWTFAFLTKAIWEGAQALPAEFTASAWDRLLLAAESLLPDIGPALVLAHTAIETRIESALRVVAGTEDPGAGLLKWMTNRGAYWKEPSVPDQLGPILRALSGHSLADDQVLWKTFKDLNGARNKFVHEGRATIEGLPVTLEKAVELIERTGKIIDWIEALLPPAERRPQYDGQTEGASVAIHIDTRPPAEETP
jgi:hypothetical protein